MFKNKHESNAPHLDIRKLSSSVLLGLLEL